MTRPVVTRAVAGLTIMVIITGQMPYNVRGGRVRSPLARLRSMNRRISWSRG